MSGFKSKLFKCSKNTVEISEALIKEKNPINTFILIHDIPEDCGYSIINICSCGVPYYGKYLFGKSKKYKYVDIKDPIIFTGQVLVEKGFYSTCGIITGFLGWAILYESLNTIKIVSNESIPRSSQLIMTALIG